MNETHAPLHDSPAKPLLSVMNKSALEGLAALAAWEMGGHVPPIAPSPPLRADSVTAPK
ncbi:MAG TPA: hypothetical protein VHE10_01465 [Candidatus Paceibacterota bacterium]|nr:hypothetical protein [Candidatus Paceibacterota bacterium]